MESFQSRMIQNIKVASLFVGAGFGAMMALFGGMGMICALVGCICGVDVHTILDNPTLGVVSALMVCVGVIVFSFFATAIDLLDD